MANMTRIKELERRLGSGGCPACSGGDPNEPPLVETNYDRPDTREPEYCEVCGRQVTFVVRWEFGDDPQTAA